MTFSHSLLDPLRNRLGRLIPSRTSVRLGKVHWSRRRFCKGWLIMGDSGTGKSSAAVPRLLASLFEHETAPAWGGLCLWRSGQKRPPLVTMAGQHGRADDVFTLGIRPPDAAADWRPAHRLDLLGDRRLPTSVLAGLLMQANEARCGQQEPGSCANRPDRWRLYGPGDIHGLRHGVPQAGMLLMSTIELLRDAGMRVTPERIVAILTEFHEPNLSARQFRDDRCQDGNLSEPQGRDLSFDWEPVAARLLVEPGAHAPRNVTYPGPLLRECLERVAENAKADPDLRARLNRHHWYGEAVAQGWKNPDPERREWLGHHSWYGESDLHGFYGPYFHHELIRRAPEDRLVIAEIIHGCFWWAREPELAEVFASREPDTFSMDEAFNGKIVCVDHSHHPEARALDVLVGSILTAEFNVRVAERLNATDSDPAKRLPGFWPLAVLLLDGAMPDVESALDVGSRIHGDSRLSKYYLNESAHPCTDTAMIAVTDSPFDENDRDDAKFMRSFDNWLLFSTRGKLAALAHERTHGTTKDEAFLLHPFRCYALRSGSKPRLLDMSR